MTIPCGTLSPSVKAKITNNVFFVKNYMRVNKKIEYIFPSRMTLLKKLAHHFCLTMTLE